VTNFVALESVEAAAYADLAEAAPRALGLAAVRTAACTALFAPGSDLLLFNRALGLGLGTPVDESTIRGLVDSYRARVVRRFALQVSPHARPPELVGWMRAAGLVAGDAWIKATRPAGPAAAPPTELRIDLVSSAQAQRFGEVACAGFGLPSGLASALAALVGRAGWHPILAWSGETPVASAALFVHDAVGWLGIAATLPGSRRLGAQGALLARRLEEGARLGCGQFVSETGDDRPERPNASWRNLERAGFALAYRRTNFVPEDA
jgi:hypothetical protein